jgi:hypothetical protein
MHSKLAPFVTQIFGENGPRSDQLHNVDEMGFDANGEVNAVVHLKGAGEAGQRHFQQVTSEHAPFWCTLLISTRADGVLVMAPMLIAQGEKGKVTHSLVHNWPYLYHQNEAGYMDKEAFAIYLKALRQQSLASLTNPQLLFYDGHGSHWALDAIQEVSEGNVHCFVLKANDSVHDQPNDNGVNSRLKALIYRKIATWRSHNPIAAIRQAIFNSIAVEAWEEFKLDAAPVIRKAFLVTGIYPFNPLPETYSRTQGGSLAELHATDEVDKEQLAAQNMGGARALAAPQLGVKLSLAGHRQGGTGGGASIVIQSASHHYFQTSFIKPAQEVAAEIAKAKSLSKQKIGIDLSKRNPDTTTGLALTAEIIAREREREAAQQAQETADAVKRAEKEGLLNQRAVTDAAAWSVHHLALLPHVALDDAPVLSKKLTDMTKPVLQQLYRHLHKPSPASVALPSSSNKPLYVAALMPLVRTYLSVLPPAVQPPTVQTDEHELTGGGASGGGASGGGGGGASGGGGGGGGGSGSTNGEDSDRDGIPAVPPPVPFHTPIHGTVPAVEEVYPRHGACEGDGRRVQL